MPALAAGKTAPAFTLPLMEGGQFSLAKALEKGPVVLAFFKVTCPVCQYAFPFVERLFQNFKGKNVSVVGITQHPQKETAQFCRQYGVTFPIAVDNPADYKVSNAYGITNVPTEFLITGGGEIEVSSVGWSRADLSEINDKLAEMEQMKQAPVLFRQGEEVITSKPG